MDSTRQGQKKKPDRLKAYNEPSKTVIEATAESQKRVNERRKQNLLILEEENTVDVDKQQYEILIGQLKAAEARNRLRIMRMRYESILEREVNHLISCQPTALRAVRLEAMLPMRPKAGAAPAAGIAAANVGESKSGAAVTALQPAFADQLTKLDKSRIERLLAD